jgi:hypothetical protein
MQEKIRRFSALVQRIGGFDRVLAAPAICRCPRRMKSAILIH